jgi:hypothetical protein
VYTLYIICFDDLIRNQTTRHCPCPATYNLVQSNLTLWHSSINFCWGEQNKISIARVDFMAHVQRESGRIQDSATQLREVHLSHIRLQIQYTISSIPSARCAFKVHQQLITTSMYRLGLCSVTPDSLSKLSSLSTPEPPFMPRV